MKYIVNAIITTDSYTDAVGCRLIEINGMTDRKLRMAFVIQGRRVNSLHGNEPIQKKNPSSPQILIPSLSLIVKLPTFFFRLPLLPCLRNFRIATIVNVLQRRFVMYNCKYITWSLIEINR